MSRTRNSATQSVIQRFNLCLHNHKFPRTPRYSPRAEPDNAIATAASTNPDAQPSPPESLPVNLTQTSGSVPTRIRRPSSPSSSSSPSSTSTPSPLPESQSLPQMTASQQVSSPIASQLPPRSRSDDIIQMERSRLRTSDNGAADATKQTSPRQQRQQPQSSNSSDGVDASSVPQGFASEGFAPIQPFAGGGPKALARLQFSRAHTSSSMLIDRHAKEILSARGRASSALASSAILANASGSTSATAATAAESDAPASEPLTTQEKLSLRQEEKVHRKAILRRHATMSLMRRPAGSAPPNLQPMNTSQTSEFSRIDPESGTEMTELSSLRQNPFSASTPAFHAFTGLIGSTGSVRTRTGRQSHQMDSLARMRKSSMMMNEDIELEPVPHGLGVSVKEREGRKDEKKKSFSRKNAALPVWLDAPAKKKKYVHKPCDACIHLN
jgi:hypothetical protein